MLIAHISDSHIAGWEQKAYARVPTARNLARCVQHINRLNPQPDLTLVTGDITYSGLTEEAECALEILEELNSKYYVTPGNHDEPASFWAAFSGERCPAERKDFLNYVINGHEIRLIAMDSTQDGAPGGGIDPAQAEWLSSKLAENKEQHTILFMHHPPVQFGVLETDEDGFKGSDMLGRIVANYPNIDRILCGHIHLEAHVHWHGTVVSTAPSMGLALSLDLSLEKPSAFYPEAPGYQLHYYHPEGHLISHTLYVRDREGPFLFDG